MQTAGLKAYVPHRLRRAARAAWQEYQLGRCMREIGALPDDGVPEPELLGRLKSAWGNDGFSANAGYLSEIAKHTRTVDGPILECGSGVSTLLLAALAARSGCEVWTLEHDPTWYAHMSDALRRHAMGTVNVCLAPLRDYGTFSWYTLPRRGFPDRFSFVICDGPPGETHGGRYGLVPVLGDRLAPGATILMDDVARAEDLEVLNRWSTEIDLEIDVCERGRESYAWAVRR